MSERAGISRLELNSAAGAKKFYLELGGRHQSDLTIMQFSRDSIASLAGLSNGHTNGHTNGHANGHANGLTNGN